MSKQRPDRQSQRLPGAIGKRERGAGMRAAGLAASRIVAPVVAGRGGGALARLKLAWAAAAGAELAATTWPASLGRDGALKLRVQSSAAVELQHRAPLVIERINTFLGRPAVTRLILVQGPLPLPPQPRREPPRSLTAAEVAALDARLADIADPGLRAGLAALGRLVLARARRHDD